ncbi:MAG: hypothetical protein WAT39_04285 [Planctomycetota bacterium]
MNQWTEADLRTIGYVAIKPWRPPPDFWVDCDIVCSIGSLADWPDDWHAHWLHNELWVYDTLDRLERVVPSTDAHAYLRAALRTLPVQFGAHRDGWSLEWNVAKANPAPIPEHYVRLGYDVCGRYTQAMLECSPLSCNGIGEDLGVNRWCLLDTLQQAIDATRHFERVGAEPGPYVVLEVWAERLPAAP